MRRSDSRGDYEHARECEGVREGDDGVSKRWRKRKRN
jgi:hypothetical protein